MPFMSCQPGAITSQHNTSFGNEIITDVGDVGHEIVLILAHSYNADTVDWSAAAVFYQRLVNQGGLATTLGLSQFTVPVLVFITPARDEGGSSHLTSYQFPIEVRSTFHFTFASKTT